MKKEHIKLCHSERSEESKILRRKAPQGDKGKCMKSIVILSVSEESKILRRKAPQDDKGKCMKSIVILSEAKNLRSFVAKLLRMT